METCAGCSARSRCIIARKTRQSIVLHCPPRRHELLQVMRQRLQIVEIKDFADSNGIEGTFTQSTGIVACAMAITRVYKKSIFKIWLHLPPSIFCVSSAGSMKLHSPKHEPVALPLLHLFGSPTVTNSR